MKITKKHLFVGSALAVISAILAYWLSQFNAITTAREDVPTAIKIMDEFIGEDPLIQIASKSYGGVFPKSFFKPNGPMNYDDGVIMWYCHDSLTGKFFLAIEPGKFSSLPTDPVSQSRSISDELSEFTGNSAEAFLSQDKKTSKKPIPINLKESNDRIDDYKFLLQKRKIENLIKHTKKYAFFQNNPEDGSADKTGLLQRLHDQPGTEFIRYYFGCDSGKKTDRIRVLLFSVDINGNNILKVPDSTDPTGTKMVNALVLQRSIPPANP